MVYRRALHFCFSAALSPRSRHTELFARFILEAIFTRSTSSLSCDVVPRLIFSFTFDELPFITLRVGVTVAVLLMALQVRSTKIGRS